MPVCSNCGEIFEEGRLVCPHCGMDSDANWSPEPDEFDFQEAEEPKERAGCAFVLLIALVCTTLLVLL